jgi:hypothetical protein
MGGWETRAKGLAIADAGMMRESLEDLLARRLRPLPLGRLM